VLFVYCCVSSCRCVASACLCSVVFVVFVCWLLFGLSCTLHLYVCVWCVSGCALFHLYVDIFVVCLLLRLCACCLSCCVVLFVSWVLDVVTLLCVCAFQVLLFLCVWVFFSFLFVLCCGPCVTFVVIYVCSSVGVKVSCYYLWLCVYVLSCILFVVIVFVLFLFHGVFVLYGALD